ncbi:MAG: hypothetical protein K2X27_25965, partial [Candidatus Obscuribacterales bacterium]|nr:hypothetical protein [Candidatus Obscuribacterales bacterium]
LQGSVLGTVGGSLAIPGTESLLVATRKMSITSASLRSLLAGATVLEQRGGWRPDKAKPNALAAAFGKECKFSPVSIQYLNSVAPDSTTNLSRRETLIKYWKESRVLSVNIERDSVVQELSAERKAQHWWSETIHLINNRITMLFDLRAVMRSGNLGFNELLEAID